MTRLADPQVVGRLRAYLDARWAGMQAATKLDDLSRILGVHSRRITEAVAFLQAESYPVGSIAGVGIFRIKDEAERLRAIRPEANRLRSLAVKLKGLGWRKQAAVVEQLALELGALDTGGRG